MVAILTITYQWYPQALWHRRRGTRDDGRIDQLTIDYLPESGEQLSANHPFAVNEAGWRRVHAQAAALEGVAQHTGL